MINRPILHGSDWWKFRFQNMVTGCIQSSFSMQMSIKGPEGQRCRGLKGCRGLSTGGIGIKGCRGSSFTRSTGIKGCRGSSFTGSIGIKGCRGSRSAEGQVVQGSRGADS